MLRNTAITAILVLGVALTAPRTAPVYGRMVASAQKFQQHFRDLGGVGHSLSPLQRFFFSLALTGAPSADPACAPHPPQRT